MCGNLQGCVGMYRDVWRFAGVCGDVQGCVYIVVSKGV